MAGEAARGEHLHSLLIAPNLAAVQINHHQHRTTSLHGIIILDDREEIILDRLVGLGTILVAGHVNAADIADNVGQNKLAEGLITKEQQVKKEGQSGLGGHKVLGAEQHQILNKSHASVGIHRGLMLLENLNKASGDGLAVLRVAMGDVADVVHDGDELRVGVAGRAVGTALNGAHHSIKVLTLATELIIVTLGVALGAVLEKEQSALKGLVIHFLLM